MPLLSITAYADFLRFDILPFGGGTFEQPADLMDELRYIHAIVQRERAKDDDPALTRKQAKALGR